MKKLMLTAALVMLASAALAEPLIGTWRTAKDDNGDSGLVKVKPCGAERPAISACLAASTSCAPCRPSGWR